MSTSDASNVEAGQTAPTVSERSLTIDSLRGLALLGVVIMNMGAMAMRFAGREIAGSAGPVDFVTMGLNLVLVQGKARACFALLFGFGIATLMARSVSKAGGARADHVRRMTALFGFGLFNQIFLFWGDILVLYALLGLIAGFAANWPLKRILTAGIVLILIPPLVLGAAEAVVGHALPSFIAFDEGAQASRGLAAVTGTSYPDVVSFSATQAIERRMADPFGMAVYDLNILGLILIGMWVARRGLLISPANHRPFLRGIAAVCIPLGIGLSLITATRLAGIHAEGLFRGVVTAAEIGFAVLAFGYLAGLALLLSRRSGPIQRMLLAPAGRLTLTNYLLSGAIGGWLFYGYGLGLMPRMTMTTLALLPIVVFVLLALASSLWLRRFRTGPAEWLWRSLAAGKRQPLLLATPAAALGLTRPV